MRALRSRVLRCGHAAPQVPHAKPLKRRDSVRGVNDLISEWGLSDSKPDQGLRNPFACSFLMVPEITGITGVVNNRCACRAGLTKATATLELQVLNEVRLAVAAVWGQQFSGKFHVKQRICREISPFWLFLSRSNMLKAAVWLACSAKFPKQRNREKLRPNSESVKSNNDVCSAPARLTSTLRQTM
ncbi:MAG: hypothetical protein SFV19_01840 [Rhodospirillaceae bacterium]|nr:hypothetical protein [Rhodospirillaceae bacterium]